MAKIELILIGDPISTQTVYKIATKGHFARMYMSQRGRDRKEDYFYQTKQQYKGKPIEKEIDLTVKLYFGTKRRVDIDNFNKLLFDSLNGLIWKDDSQIQSMVITKEYDKKNPRIELIIDY